MMGYLPTYPRTKRNERTNRTNGGQRRHKSNRPTRREDGGSLLDCIQIMERDGTVGDDDETQALTGKRTTLTHFAR